jgi:hypothetical protein
MRSVALACVCIFLFSTIGSAGQTAQTPAGDWRVQFVTPLGQHAVNMTISQSGTKLTGHVTDEYGEYPVTGQFVDGTVTAIWSVSEEGKPLEITMKGRLEGNEIRGTATLGAAGEGTLYARRTGGPSA